MATPIFCVECTKSVCGSDLLKCNSCCRNLHKPCFLNNAVANYNEKKCLPCSSRQTQILATDSKFNTKDDPITCGAATIANNAPYSDFYDKSACFDINSLNRTLSKLDLLIMHFNVRRIQKNFDQLSMILTELQKLPDIIALTETKLSPNQIPTNIDQEGYEFVHCDSSSKSGGVGFYIKKAITYKLKRNINLDLANFEDLWIEVLTKTGPAAIGVICRHPSYLINDYELFFSSFCDIFCQFNAEKMPFHAVGDYNIDLMRVNANSSVKSHVHYIINSSCKCVIDLPTRITSHSKTPLDHIYVSDNTRHVNTSGMLLTDLRNHFGTFIADAEKKMSYR